MTSIPHPYACGECRWRVKPLASIFLFAAACGIAAATGGPTAADPLVAGFTVPPADVRPQTFWFWMNGNVSRDGITRDLEAMKRVGMGGAMIFDGGTYLPAGPADYLGQEWRTLMTHAFQEGDRLGLAVGMHNGPGWSSSGGPWVTPELAMQQIVWTEATISGGRRVEVELPQPQSNLGHYRDALVLAFPALPGEEIAYRDFVARASRGSQPITADVLSDGQTGTVVSLEPEAPLLVEFREAADFHALTVQPGPRAAIPRLRVEASIDGKAFVELCTVASVGRHGIAAPAASSFAPVRARFIRATPAATGQLAEFAIHRTPRIRDWPAKANFDYRVAGQMAVPAAGTGPAIDPGTVRDVTAFCRSGRLIWDAPPGRWTILRLGHTPTGKENVAASAAGRGLETDKFSSVATEHHFRRVIATVRADAAAAGVAGPRVLTIDSYEAGMQNWTAGFLSEFRRRTGYDLATYAPALVGRVVGDVGISDRFLYDFRRVQADLMAENYYMRMGALARAHGMRFFVEGYGPGAFDELRVSGVPDVPMAEFWARTPWTPNRVVKMVASAAHVYSRPVVAAESFTGWSESSRWLEYPYALKPLGDEMFAQGVNQIVFHRYAHQPHPDAAPGMAMGPYGMHFERTNNWFEQSRGWIDYLSRCHFMLRQGTHAADVLYFTGERSPDPAQYALPVLPAGYDYDLVNADVLLNRVRIEDGEFRVADGGRYRLLVLPPNLKAMRPELMRRINEFVAQGAVVLGAKPVFSPTLQGYPETEREMLGLADELWDPVRTGPGRVLTGLTIAEALQRLDVRPDFLFQGSGPDAALAWEHRRLPDGELFFLANRQRRAEEVTASFRGMAGRQPEIWHPETGERRLAAVYSAEDGRAILPLRLEPAESLFVLFRRAAEPAATAVRRDGLAVTGSRPPATTRPAAGDFTMAIWVKPDTNLRVMPEESTNGRIDEVGKYYAIPADPGDIRFGAGHATAGLAVGRNGIFVVERAEDSCPAVLVAPVPVSGWSHVAVVYRAGTPHLYVDGTEIRRGLKSGKIVHSGIGSPPPPPEYVLHFPGIEALTRSAGEPPPSSRGQVYHFEGNSAAAESFPRALTGAEIAALAARGVPAPALPEFTGLARTPDGEVTALVWQTGAYALDDGPALSAAVPRPREVSGPWRVTFPPGRGAPAQIELLELRSLHRHGDSGVRHFSGTANYSCTMQIPAAYFAPDRRVVLDLGRVEVLAEVLVNGREAGLAWKEPYRLDITALARAGANALEVRVTNLWPNRLIGDEQLPTEDSFGVEDERGVEAAGITRLPEWYRQGRPKPPGGRITFATWRFYSKDEPLLASGLLGPVRVLNPVHLAWRDRPPSSARDGTGDAASGVDPRRGSLSGRSGR